jgi:hypothetical protein
MKGWIALLLIFAFPLNAPAQSKSIDDVAASIPDASCVSVDALASYIKQNFATDSARVRAIYVWITNHINYDVPRFLAREKNPNSPPQPVADVLSTRNAVCQGYSDLFAALCKNVGIRAVVVNGYTRLQGKISPVAHAWVAANLNNQWYLFDPTWGAGYVANDRFVRRFNNSFYQVLPSSLITDHMPFDPMYQFLSYPLTHQEFTQGSSAASKTVFQYNDSLNQFASLSDQEQMSAELRRLEASGIQNDLLKKRQRYLMDALQAIGSKDAFDEGGKAFNNSIALYKEYIEYKNKQFSSINDADLKQLIDSVGGQLKLSRSLLMEAVPKTAEQRQAKNGNLSNIERFWVQLQKEKQFVDQYLAADPAARKQLFGRR